MALSSGDRVCVIDRIARGPINAPSSDDDRVLVTPTAKYGNPVAFKVATPTSDGDRVIVTPTAKYGNPVATKLEQLCAACSDGGQAVYDISVTSDPTAFGAQYACVHLANTFYASRQSSGWTYSSSTASPAFFVDNTGYECLWDEGTLSGSGTASHSITGSFDLYADSGCSNFIETFTNLEFQWIIEKRYGPSFGSDDKIVIFDISTNANFEGIFFSTFYAEISNSACNSIVDSTINNQHTLGAGDIKVIPIEYVSGGGIPVLPISTGGSIFVESGV